MNKREKDWFDKMIPKDTLLEFYKIDGHKLVRNDLCPTCKYGVDYPDNYCKNCGQSLKWPTNE